jgi:DinB superfamily
MPRSASGAANRADKTRAYASRAMEHEHCDACGFDGRRYDDASLLDALRALGPRWRALLDAAGAKLRARPEPDVWSAIEYAAHSRDITALHAFGVEQALTLDEPSFPAIADDLVDSAAVTYNSADPAEVVDALEQHTNRLAQLADDAGPDQWSRGLTIGEDRSDVRRLLEHALHDSLHHVDDVERGLARLAN